MENQISWTFGEMESVLAALHSIDQTKRTAFQSRLKNFHRLGYPFGFAAIKGRAATYSPGQIVDMALAVEMTQLGLPPERVIWVLLTERWPTMMAMRMAASTLAEHPDGFDGATGEPLAMFLYFDPAALNSLTQHMPAKVMSDMDGAANSFFYGGIGIVRESLIHWTSGAVPRLSLINLTAMIDNVACSPYDQGTEDDRQYRLAFFGQLEAEASKFIDDSPAGEGREADHALAVMEREGVMDPVVLATRLGISPERAGEHVAEFEAYQRKRHQ